jgi:Flp pilus assembly protein TadB
MHTVTSFHSSSVGPEQLSTVMADYVALERARTQRRSLVTGFGVLALFIAVAGGGFHWLSPLASWLGIAFCVIPSTWAWVVELGYDRRLAHRLEELPGAVTHVVVPPDEKVTTRS